MTGHHRGGSTPYVTATNPPLRPPPHTPSTPSPSGRRKNNFFSWGLSAMPFGIGSSRGTGVELATRHDRAAKQLQKAPPTKPTLKIIQRNGFFSNFRLFFEFLQGFIMWHYHLPFF